MLKPTYKLPPLPPPGDLETPAILRELVSARANLAELKGRAATMPNQGILIDTLALQEAKASSEIENIVTTQDELFQAGMMIEGLVSPAAKEVAKGLSATLYSTDLYRNGQLGAWGAFDGYLGIPAPGIFSDIAPETF